MNYYNKLPLLLYGRSGTWFSRSTFHTIFSRSVTSANASAGAVTWSLSWSGSQTRELSSSGNRAAFTSHTGNKGY
jgi:hypothetical protein